MRVLYILEDIEMFNRMMKCHILKLNCRRWDTRGAVVVKTLIRQFRTFFFVNVNCCFVSAFANTRLEKLKFIEVIYKIICGFLIR